MQGAQMHPHLETHDNKKVVHSSHQDHKAFDGTYHNQGVFHGSEHDTEIVKLLAFPINKISAEVQSRLCSLRI